MRTRAELRRLGEGLRAPLRGFVRESGVRIALLITSSGQVLAQHGFARALEVGSVASLAAAAHAAAGALGEVVGSGGWTHLHQEGERQQMLIAPIRTPAELLILVAVFDRRSSLGLVRLFCDRFGAEARALPELQRARRLEDPTRFERELDAGLDSVFGGAGGS